MAMCRQVFSFRNCLGRYWQGKVIKDTAAADHIASEAFLGELGLKVAGVNE
jgi:hypothetical protein